jgi:hypothetical protein
MAAGKWCFTKALSTESTIYKGSKETSPQIHHVSRIMGFLRYDPFPTPDFHADKLRKIRRAWA